jgi:DNA-binding NtrC family response regulator
MERLGGTQLIPVEARFIAATNQDLKKLIKEGYFREDLYFRLNVVTINLPPLNKRKDDIHLLANFFLKKYSIRLKKNISGISDKALTLLQSYSYPGNVRELENLIERAVMLTPGKVLLDDVIGEINREKSPVPLHLPLVSSDFAQSRDYILTLFEKQFVKEQLSRFEGNVSAAAKASNMSRQNFHRLMVKHQITFNDG